MRLWVIFIPVWIRYWEDKVVVTGAKAKILVDTTIIFDGIRNLKWEWRATKSFQYGFLFSIENLPPNIRNIFKCDFTFLPKIAFTFVQNPKLWQLSIKANCETQSPASIGRVALSSVIGRSSRIRDTSSHLHYMMFKIIQNVRIWSWQNVSVICSFFITELIPVYCCLVVTLYLILKTTILVLKRIWWHLKLGWGVINVSGCLFERPLRKENVQNISSIVSPHCRE